MKRSWLSVALVATLFTLSACDEDDVSVGTITDEAMVIRPEVEPNGAAATATPLVGLSGVVQGTILPNADGDFYSFTGALGDRVYAATMTSWSTGATATLLEVIGPDGTTVLETDLTNGSLGGSSSSIAGTVLTAPGTYYLRVAGSTATSQLRPYDLHFHIRRGVVANEAEGNDVHPGEPIGAGWINGTLSATTDVDHYSVALNAGDTVFVSLDADPERDNIDSLIGLGFGLVAITPPTGGTSHINVNDAGAVGPDSEALFFTAKAAGTYSARVFGTAIGNYHLNLVVHPVQVPPPGCRTYTASVPVPLPVGPNPGPGVITTIVVPPGEDMIIGDIDFHLQAQHGFMSDLVFLLTRPDGSQNGVATNIGSGTANTNIDMDVTIDDEAAFPVTSLTIVAGTHVKSEANRRMNWLDGQHTAGTWTLDVRDEFTGDGGNLLGWGFTVCPAPPPPACALGEVPVTVFGTAFEIDDSGFTSSGVLNQWTRGTPTGSAINTCASGLNCFKTNLTGVYAFSSQHNLLSPTIDLTGLTGTTYLRWQQKYQLETSSFDHASVDIRRPGAPPTNTIRLFEYLDGTMSEAFGGGAFATTVQETAGWGQRMVNITGYNGGPIELLFHLDGDASGSFAGLAIDDVEVITCVATCGNGTLDPGELCDDSNSISGDGCDANCTPTGCGNGIMTGTEVCDDSNTSSGDGCNALCTSDESCGNDFLDPNEACDDDNIVSGDGCNATCTSDEACGTGFTDPNEACDDNNTTSGDGCNATCTSDESCGNDFDDPGEVCDDGNNDNGDGCNDTCESLEVCGNDFVDFDEACDDGNVVSNDGCNALCTSDESCGNGFDDPGETCDDGNTANGDGCNATCVSLEVCGNSFTDFDEMCDDGNTVGLDGCSADCSSDETCGNGIRELEELCDDDNNANGDGCEANCTITENLTTCGDNVVDVGEVCDDGNTADGDGCGFMCRSLETCGNYIHDEAAGEQCDDGNTEDGDDCEADCRLLVPAYCGDGNRDDDEQCDDGNDNWNDDCNSICEINPPVASGCGCSSSAPGSSANGLLAFGVLGLLVLRKRRKR